MSWGASPQQLNHDVGAPVVWRRVPRARLCANGLTIIEVLVALVMLVLISGMIGGMGTYISNMRDATQHRMNAMEVAHRVILQYIDDPDLLKETVGRVQQGQYIYRFEYDEQLLQTIAPKTEGANTHDARVRRIRVQAAGVTLRVQSRVHEVSVRVYLDHEGHQLSDNNVVLAELARAHDPLRDSNRTLEVMEKWFGGQLDTVDIQ